MKGASPIRLFPELYNIKDFKVTAHPKFHPDSTDYTRYWEAQERLCIEGKWGEDRRDDKGGWRWMPGNLYYYINMCVIEQQGPSNTVVWKRPLLRDVEWMLSYGWITCRGFSGFSGDSEFTCHRVIKEMNDLLNKGKTLEDLTPKQKTALKRFENVLVKDYETTLDEEGNEIKTPIYKTYIDAREYLYKTFDKPMGKPLFDNEALNFFVLGSRGFGKSFFCGNAVVGHEFTFRGAKELDDSYLDEDQKVEIFVGSALSSKSSDLLSKFTASQNFAKKQLGAWETAEEFVPGFFYVPTQGTLSPNNKGYTHSYMVKRDGEWVPEGSMTVIKHGTYTTENPQAAVGTRPTVMVIEEVGLLANLLTVHGANETCQIRDTKFGSSFYIGTGGNMEKITESKIVFEDPQAYKFLPYHDVFEGRQKPIGFFMPAYYVDNQFKDEHGNTKLEEAWEQEMYERKLREDASSSSALNEYIMARPIVPSEMFLNMNMNIFPTALLRERLADVEVNKLDEMRESVGWLEWSDSERKEVVWKDNAFCKPKKIPIKEMNLDVYKGDISGAITIYEHPDEKMPDPTYRQSLYKIVYDPVKDDNGGTSLASILVYKGFSANSWNEGLQGTIVAEYIGRLDRVNDIHEIAIKLGHYYNSKVMVENNIPDFIRYCRMNGYYHMLQPSPYIAISKVIQNPGKKYDVGVTMSKQLNVHCEQLARQLLLDDWKVNENGEKKYMLHKLLSKRLLNEFISYDRELNFDHISSFKLLALWLSQEREEPVADPEEQKDRYKELDRFILKRKYSKAKLNNPFYV